MALIHLFLDETDTPKFALRNSSGLDSYVIIKNDGSAYFAGDVTSDGTGFFEGGVRGTVNTISDGGAWNMLHSNFWTASGGTIANPSEATSGQTGVIYCTAEVNAFGNLFSFPGGTPPTIPANSVVPYYVDVSNKIRLGTATEDFR